MLLLDTTLVNPGLELFIPGFNSTKVIQVVLEGDANIKLYGKMSPDAPWTLIKSYTQSVIESFDAPKYLYADRDVGIGRARVWIA